MEKVFYLSDCSQCPMYFEEKDVSCCCHAKGIHSENIDISCGFPKWCPLNEKPDCWFDEFYCGK